MSKHEQEPRLITSVIKSEEANSAHCFEWRRRELTHCPLAVGYCYCSFGLGFRFREIFGPLLTFPRVVGGHGVHHHPVQLHVQQQLCGRHEQETHPHHNHPGNQGVSLRVTAHIYDKSLDFCILMLCVTYAVEKVNKKCKKKKKVAFFVTTFKFLVIWAVIWR